MVSGHDSEVRGPSAYSPSRSNKSSPCSSPTHPQSSSSGGNSLNSSPHSSNGFVSNGIQNGVSGDVETLMEIEEENEVEIARNGVLNGSASQEEITCSPRRGNAFLFHFYIHTFLHLRSYIQMCWQIKVYVKYNFVETPREIVIAKLSIRKLGSSSVLKIMHYY